MTAFATNHRRLAGAILPPVLLLGGWAIYGALNQWVESRVAELQGVRPTVGTDIALQNRLIGAVRTAMAQQGRAGNWDKALDIADSACTPRQCPTPIREMRAEAHLRRGDFPKASAEFKELLGGRVPPDANRMSRMPGMAMVDTGAADPIAKAIYLALVGDISGYASHRREISRRALGTQLSALDANNTAWACVYLPGDPADFQVALGLAQSAVDRAEPDSKATYLNTLGVVQYRAGKAKEALASLLEAERLETEPANWPFLALACEALGKPDDARRWAGKLDKALLDSYGSDTSNRREFLLFHRELGGILHSPESDSRKPAGR